MLADADGVRAEPVAIRAGTPEDLEGVLEVYNHYVLHTAATFEVVPLRPTDRQPWLAEHTRGGRYRIVVAVDAQHRVIGWATTSPFRPRAAYETTVESSVYCHPEARGQGLGSALYRALFEAIAGEDIERIVAGVALPNPESVALHQKFGFRPVGTFTSVGRKFGRFWDTTWFERPLRLLPAPP